MTMFARFRHSILMVQNHVSILYDLHSLTTIPFSSSLASARTVCPFWHLLEAGVQADFSLRHLYFYCVRSNTLSTHVLQSSAYGLYRQHACVIRIAAVHVPGELRMLNHADQCYW